MKVSFIHLLFLVNFFIIIAVEGYALGEVNCPDNASNLVKVKMETGEQLILPPALLLGNGLEKALQDIEVSCGRRALLLDSIRIPLRYLDQTGTIEVENWPDETTVTNVTMSSTYGAKKTYMSTKERFDRYKSGTVWTHRKPAFCTVSEDNLEFCATCAADPLRPAYCFDSSILIQDWSFIVSDKRKVASKGEDGSLYILCQAVLENAIGQSRTCDAQFVMESGLFVAYEIIIRNEHQITSVNFVEHHYSLMEILEKFIIK